MNKKLSVCTIGGGSGMPIVNKALIKAGIRDIHSIVTTFDSGGDTGRMRTDERGRILAFSDYWRALISLWDDGKQKELWEDMLRFRDGRTRNFGNIFFQFMSEKVGDLSMVDKLFADLTGARLCGEIIPVSTDPADVCFKTESGTSYCGEHHLDGMRMSLDKVEKVWLSPDVEANPEAIEAVVNSKIIIICPGSMYGSVITNLLPLGMVNAFNKSKARKILMTNIMSVANENNGFDQNDYIRVFAEYLSNEQPFDEILMADLSKLDESLLAMTLKNYEYEHSYPIRHVDNCQIKTMLADIAKVETENNRLRHSVNKLSEYFKLAIL